MFRFPARPCVLDFSLLSSSCFVFFFLFFLIPFPRVLPLPLFVILTVEAADSSSLLEFTVFHVRKFLCQAPLSSRSRPKGVGKLLCRIQELSRPFLRVEKTMKNIPPLALPPPRTSLVMRKTNSSSCFFELTREPRRCLWKFLRLRL